MPQFWPVIVPGCVHPTCCVMVRQEVTWGPSTLAHLKDWVSHLPPVMVFLVPSPFKAEQQQQQQNGQHSSNSSYGSGSSSGTLDLGRTAAAAAAAASPPPVCSAPSVSQILYVNDAAVTHTVISVNL